MSVQFLHSVDAPIVQTALGKIHGFQLDGIYTFLGIQYAHANRFQMPAPVKPWDGVKKALSYGYTCPGFEYPLPAQQAKVSFRYWPADENCQNLNIWTNSLEKGAKKPVMVWIHGGSFKSGSAIEHPAYDGDNMARYHDVVFVNLNHRLNILGHLDMSSFSKKYENSVNAGIADLIEALKWVRDNIENFGGDPNNVTIFGQSGGGRKTTTLMQTPAAAGLFHKAIIESGTVEGWDPVSSEHHKKIISMMLDELNIPETEYEKLESVPYRVLVRAYIRSRIKLDKLEGIVTTKSKEWTPVKNGWFLGAPPVHEFSEYARKVPLMIGSNICEIGNSPVIPDRNTCSAERKREILKETYGDNTDKLIELFQKAYPGKNELLLLDFDATYRPNLLNYVERKIKESNPGVPLYFYIFALEFEFEGGKGAWHSSEIPFVFHNADKFPVNHIEGVMQKLQNEMAGAWASFARSGDPNHSELDAKWPAYDLEKRGVMVFDRKSEVRYDHERELVALQKSSSGNQKTRRGVRPHQPLEEEKWIY